MGNAPRKRGRPPGSLNQRSREIAAKAIESGITPLEIMVGAMREAWDSGDRDKAVQFAEKAAPYMHPRIQSMELTGADGGPMQVSWPLPRTPLDGV
jgi:hypothetical protein